MKLVQIIYSGLGGHGDYIFSLINGDKEKQIQHSIIFFGIEDLKSEYVHLCEKHDLEYRFIKKKQGLSPASFIQLFQALKELNPKAIAVHSSVTLPVCLLYRLFFNTKIIFVEHQANHLKTKREWYWSALAQMTAQHVVFLTQLYAEQIKEKISQYKEDKSNIIPTGINISDYQHLKVVDKKPVILGMQSRLVKIKDHETLIKAMLSIEEEAELHIAGDGDTREELEQLVEQYDLGNRIKFHGMLDKQELDQFMSKLDIYIHATFGETLSIALIQAMSYGLPIIASDVTGVNNMINHQQTGILVEVRNINALSQAANELIHNPNMRNDLSANARTYAENNFSNEVMFKKYLTLVNT